MQASLGAHWDESCFSFVVQLNDLSEFSGGGTKFAHSSEAISVAPGEVLCFCGYNLHEGVPITEGVRATCSPALSTCARRRRCSRDLQTASRLWRARNGCARSTASPTLPLRICPSM